MRGDEPPKSDDDDDDDDDGDDYDDHGYTHDMTILVMDIVLEFMMMT